MMMAMKDTYKAAVRGFEVPEPVDHRIRGLIWDAWNLHITYQTPEVIVEAVTCVFCGTLSAIGMFHSLLEAQSFAWAWLTGPYGVVKDVRFVKIGSRTFGIDMGVLAHDVRSYLSKRLDKKCCIGGAE